MFKKMKPPKGTEAKLDAILHYLDKMNRRDRLRTWGGFFRGLITMIPAVIVIASIVYLYYNYDEVMQNVARIAAEQTAAVTGQSADALMQGMDTETIMNEIKKYLGQ